MTAFDEGTPIYRQIAEGIAADILSGALAPGDQVMSTTRYAAFHRVNPATVAKGFQQLVDDGLLTKKRGIGMFVSPDAPDRLRTRRRERFFADVVDPMVSAAALIGIPLDEVVAHIQGRREGVG
jgi:DNA-binding transcriptional regulator YhcF (GntR family)